AKPTAAKGGSTLRIAQWVHFVPAYDEWFDQEFTRRWGEEHGVDVVVDHIPFAQARDRADTELAAQRGHDIWSFISPPAIYEDQAIDHRDIVEEVEANLGTMAPLFEGSVRNPKTGAYFGFPDFWVANPVLYRTDLWDRPPASWGAVLEAGARLKATGHPLGIGMSPDLDPAQSLLSFLFAYGASIQDEDGNLAINRPATVEAVELGAALYRTAMTDEVFGWDGASDNRYLASGRASLIVDAISALRATELQDPDLAAKVALAPIPAGPVARLSPPSLTTAYIVWRFSPNIEVAKRFLVDLTLASRESFIRSGFYNLPGFPGGVPDLATLVAHDTQAKPADKYAVLGSAGDWSVNVGHPGSTSAAVDEIVNLYLVPKMFAAAARGEMTAGEAVAAAEAQMRPIFDKWRERGKI
ncbi:MAG TPA: extracellular solute-binding protein, partial [Acidimicrobiia bacterium]|nr:extracellular solute-binding protein [Acidimicrobiia bacterium]